MQLKTPAWAPPKAGVDMAGDEIATNKSAEKKDEPEVVLYLSACVCLCVCVCVYMYVCMCLHVSTLTSEWCMQNEEEQLQQLIDWFKKQNVTSVTPLKSQEFEKVRL